MTKTIFCLALTLCLPAGAAFADSMGKEKSMSSDSMMKMDANKDGMLSKSEMSSDKTMMSKFDAMDANKDGMLDSKEMSGMNSGMSGSGGMSSGGMEKGTTGSPMN